MNLDFLTSFIKLTYKLCSFPSICISLSFAFIDGLARAIAGGGIKGFFSSRNLPRETEKPIDKKSNCNFSYTPMTKEQSREIERQKYLQNKESLRKRRNEEK